MGPERVRTMSMPNKFGVEMPLFNKLRVETLKEKINNGTLTGRALQKWNEILAVDNTYIPQGPIDPWQFPFYYEDPTGSDALEAIVRADIAKAIDLGVRWKVLGNYQDAQAVERILLPWTTIQTIASTGDSRLQWSIKWPMFIQAAQQIEDAPNYSTVFDNAMKAQTEMGLEASTAYIQTENRAVWGCLLEVASAGYLNDRTRFDNAIERWRELFDHDVKLNVPVGEVARAENGLYYCNFLLNAMTQVAEIARFYGEWLYDYKTPDGSTFKALWENVAHWTAIPADYTYWPGSSTVRIQAHVDPLHALWPNSWSTTLINTYTTTLDYYGSRQGMLAYRDRPLYG